MNGRRFRQRLDGGRAQKTQALPGQTKRSPKKLLFVLGGFLLSGVLSSSVITYGALVRAEPALASIFVYLAGWLIHYGALWQLRIVRQSPDASGGVETSGKKRTFRWWIILEAAVVQVGSILLIDPRLFFAILPLWLYLGMSLVFRPKRPGLFLGWGALFLPAIDLMLLFLEWLPGESWRDFPWAVTPFLLMSLLCGALIELSRGMGLPRTGKRPPAITGFATVWGARKAAWGYYGLLIATGLLILYVAWQTDLVELVAGTIIVWMIGGWFLAKRFAQSPIPKLTVIFLPFSGILVTMAYALLGFIPFILVLIASSSAR